MIRRIPWARVLVEAFVIVASILIAFGIDAWWDARAERGEERTALQGLMGDFDAAGHLLEASVLVIDSAATAAEAILNLVDPEGDPGLADSLAVLIPQIIRRPVFLAPMGTLEALLGSGDLGLTSNDTLRAALASFPSHVADMSVTQEFGSQVVFGSLLPFLNERVPMLRYGLMATGESGFVGDPGGLMRSMEFENLAQNRLMGIRFEKLVAEEMAHRIASVRALIGAELVR